MMTYENGWTKRLGASTDMPKAEKKKKIPVYVQQSELTLKKKKNKNIEIGGLRLLCATKETMMIIQSRIYASFLANFYRKAKLQSNVGRSPPHSILSLTQISFFPNSGDVTVRGEGSGVATVSCSPPDLRRTFGGGRSAWAAGDGGRARAAVRATLAAAGG